jgi:hypothetical protein
MIQLLAALALTVPAGETWIFAIKHGEPANARKAEANAAPRAGEVKVSVKSAFGTMMTISSNSAQGYRFEAQLIGADGKATAARTCTLPRRNQPALETWQQKAAAVRIGKFRPAKGGRC